MLKKYLENIENNSDKKSALLELKNYLKESERSGGIIYENSEVLSETVKVLKNMLADEDPKIRKNSDVCLGITGGAAG